MNQPLSGSDEPGSSFRRAAPRLSRRRLSWLLGGVALIPVATVLGLWWYLPPVTLDTLEVEMELVGGPPESYYDWPLPRRNALPEMRIALTNTGREAWSHVIVRVNQFYEIFEHDTDFLPGERREYLLHRFASRTGATFDMRYNRVGRVMVYARLPNHRRATAERRWDR